MTLSFAPERIETWPLVKLQPCAKNAKVHGADQVAKIVASMAEFGWTLPCRVGEDGELIAGHGRVLAATQLGLTEAGLLYRYAPARRPPRWSWVTPGAGVATALWLGGSLLFSFFVRSFGNYQPTYGALAEVVVLLLYIWLTALVVLLGALLNAEMEHQSRRDAMRGRVRPMGERDAEMADTLGRRP